MWPDEPFAEGRGSFLRPVLPPNFDPDASPTYTLSINCTWLPYIRGALQQLLLQATWDTDDPATLLLAQQRVFNLISMFGECESLVLPFSCDFDMESSTDGAPFQLRPEACFDTSPLSQFSSGVGFTSLDVYDHCDDQTWSWCECETFFSERHITFIVMGFDKISGTYYTSPGNDINIIGWHSGSVVFEEVRNSQALPDGTGLSLAWTGDEVLDQITLRCGSGLQSGHTNPGGSATIRTCRIDGYAAASLCGSQ